MYIEIWKDSERGAWYGNMIAILEKESSTIMGLVQALKFYHTV